jgi:hypothetical protein
LSNSTSREPSSAASRSSSCTGVCSSLARGFNGESRRRGASRATWRLLGLFRCVAVAAAASTGLTASAVLRDRRSRASSACSSPSVVWSCSSAASLVRSSSCSSASCRRLAASSAALRCLAPSLRSSVSTSTACSTSSASSSGGTVDAVGVCSCLGFNALAAPGGGPCASSAADTGLCSGVPRRSRGVDQAARLATLGLAPRMAGSAGVAAAGADGPRCMGVGAQAGVAAALGLA